MKAISKKKRCFLAFISFLLITSMLFNLSGCSALILNVKAQDLMDGVKANTVQGKTADEKFIGNTADFAIDLFKKTASETNNSLISPLSVMLALAMTANGADKETLAQMQKVLGKDIPLDQLNEYLYSYVKNLPSERKSKLSIANSIWFRDDTNYLTVEKNFLQKNADYYSAAAYKSAFDSQTLKDINNWVKSKTDGMIDKILDNIAKDAVMYLINAVVFDARWEKVYIKNDINSDDFIAVNDSKQTAKFMHSVESKYLEDINAVGFIKPYYNNKYSFAALLPNEGVSINDYIQSLTGERFLSIIKNAGQTEVGASLPKFSYDYSIHMNDALKALGMPVAFADNADFSKLGHTPDGNIYISDVLHKTFISVDELGTKAGAVTKVEMSKSTAMETKTVNLNRPFVYAIIDNATNLPVFIGAVMSMN